MMGLAIILEGTLNPSHQVSPREDDCYPWGRCRDPGQRGRCRSRPGCLRVVVVFFLLVSLVKSTRQFSNKSKVGGDVDDIDDDWMSRGTLSIFLFFFCISDYLFKGNKTSDQAY